MRAHVVLSPAELDGARLGPQAAVVVDVLRASTSVVAACAAGCAGVVPARDAEAARARAGAGTLLAGERGGEPIPGFDLGNSPLEFTAERVGGRTIVLTTTNGTRAMMAGGRAAVVAVGALTNLGAAARWVAGQGRDVVVLCAGEAGGFALEDAVCAGLLLERVAGAGVGLQWSDAAVAARRLGEHYGPRLHLLREEAGWARALLRAGRGADVEACLAVDGQDEVPVLEHGVIRPGPAGRGGASSGQRASR
jgi:2-phosphosulfolactate phosphatase